MSSQENYSPFFAPYSPVKQTKKTHHISVTGGELSFLATIRTIVGIKIEISNSCDILMTFIVWTKQYVMFFFFIGVSTLTF